MKKYAGFIIAGVLGGLITVALLKMLLPMQIMLQDKPLDSRVKEKLVTYTVPAEAQYDFTKAAGAAVNSVVHIKTEFMKENTGYFYDPFQDFFWGNGTRRYKNYTPVMASGSGVIISADGFIVTNRHVVKDADNILVVLNDKREYEAKVVGKDPATDIALLKIDETELPYLPYGNSDDVEVGQWVLAVGNPYNLTSTVTAGIVSAKGRNINILHNDRENNLPAVESFIQTDAAVNPGNSGGALVSANGKLIGINTAIQSNTGSYAGYAFAIPVNIVRKVVNDLLEFGTVQRAFIGVSIRNIDNDLAQQLNLDDLKGVYISGLMENGAAEKAGLKIGDIIIKVDGKEVDKVPELQEQVSKYSPGDKITLSIRRKGKVMNVPVELKNSNGNTDIVKVDAGWENVFLGAHFENVPDDLKNKLGINNGLQIVDIKPGKFMSTGMRKGFIITRIDKKPINDFNDLKTTLEAKKGGILIEGIYPNAVKAYYGFGM